MTKTKFLCLFFAFGENSDLFLWAEHKMLMISLIFIKNLINFEKKSGTIRW